MFMCGRRQLGAYSICTLLLHVARTRCSVRSQYTNPRRRTSSVHGSPLQYILSTRISPAVHPRYTDPSCRTSSVHVVHSSEYGCMPRAVHPQYAYSLYSGSMLRCHLVSYSSSSTSAWLLPVSAITSSRFRKGACRKGGRGWGEGGRGGQHQQPGLTASAWGSRTQLLIRPPAHIAVQPGLSFILLPCPYFPLTLPPPLVSRSPISL